MTLDCEVVLTRSGAPAMLDRATGEIMHPVVGPLVEVPRLYLGPSRLRERLRTTGAEPLTLLDVGLGAGSNAAAAFQLSEAMTGSDRRLEIVSLDRSLSALSLALNSEHRAAFGLDGVAGVAAARLLEQGRYESARTTWRFVEGALPSTLRLEPACSVDVVFWDPFSPRANPSLWTLAAFTDLRRLCRDGATVHTYSRATAIRSALLMAGFFVGVEDEMGGERQGTSAATRPSDLARPLDRRFLERLRRSSAPLPPDSPEDALERVSRHPQWQATRT